MTSNILKKLLVDKTTGKNIIWACDTYGLPSQDSIEVDQVRFIKRRIDKTKEEQKDRSKKKAEVFTPSWVCCMMINTFDEEWFGRKDVFNSMQDKKWTPNPNRIFEENDSSWHKFIDSTRIEITCGEAPYLVSRYDTTTGESLPINMRIGLLDRKLRVINECVSDEEEWFNWVVRAYKSIYGFEFQGDNLYLARENLLLTFVEYYQDRWNKEPSSTQLEDIVEIITWNLWQMDGLKYCIPFNESILCRIKDWQKNEVIVFKHLTGELL